MFSVNVICYRVLTVTGTVPTAPVLLEATPTVSPGKPLSMECECWIASGPDQHLT